MLKKRKISISISRRALEVLELNKNEKEQLEKQKSLKKQQQWLKARKALKRLLFKHKPENPSQDTSLISFPNREFSISHCKDYAVAVYIESEEKEIKGVGVDLEHERYPKPGSEKYFLSGDEINWLQSMPNELQEEQRLRLWTIKEALYKAHPNNHQSRLTLIKLKKPSSSFGYAETGDYETESKLKFQYFCFELPIKKPVKKEIEEKTVSEYSDFDGLSEQTFLGLNEKLRDNLKVNFGYLTIAFSY